MVVAEVSGNVTKNNNLNNGTKIANAVIAIQAEGNTVSKNTINNATKQAAVETLIASNNATKSSINNGSKAALVHSAEPSTNVVKSQVLSQPIKIVEAPEARKTDLVIA